jgi:hypothetical protein
VGVPWQGAGQQLGKAQLATASERASAIKIAPTPQTKAVRTSPSLPLIRFTNIDLRSSRARFVTTAGVLPPNENSAH